MLRYQFWNPHILWEKYTSKTITSILLYLPNHVIISYSVSIYIVFNIPTSKSEPRTLYILRRKWYLIWRLWFLTNTIIVSKGDLVLTSPCQRPLLYVMCKLQTRTVKSNIYIVHLTFQPRYLHSWPDHISYLPNVCKYKVKHILLNNHLLVKYLSDYYYLYYIEI